MNGGMRLCIHMKDENSVTFDYIGLSRLKELYLYKICEPILA